MRRITVWCTYLICAMACSSPDDPDSEDTEASIQSAAWTPGKPQPQPWKDDPTGPSTPPPPGGKRTRETKSTAK